MECVTLEWRLVSEGTHLARTICNLWSHVHNQFLPLLVSLHLRKYEGFKGNIHKHEMASI